MYDIVWPYPTSEAHLPDPKLIKIGGPCKNLEKQTMAIKRNWLENPKKYIEYIYIYTYDQMMKNNEKYGGKKHKWMALMGKSSIKWPGITL